MEGKKIWRNEGYGGQWESTERALVSGLCSLASWGWIGDNGLLSIRVLAVKYWGGKKLLKLKKDIGSRKNGNELTINSTDEKITFLF